MIEVTGSYLGLRIKEVAESLFSRKYYADCLDFDQCRDICCSYGCDVDTAERDRILAFTDQLEPRLGIPAACWFENDLIKDASYPSGLVARTRVYDERCVFHDRRARGCLLHHFANEKGMDWRQLKPMVCAIFPITWERGRLLTSPFLEELPCNDRGTSVFQAQKQELKNFFGDHFVNDIEHAALQMKSY